MKVKELNLQEIEVSLTLGGTGVQSLGIVPITNGPLCMWERDGNGLVVDYC